MKVVNKRMPNQDTSNAISTHSKSAMFLHAIYTIYVSTRLSLKFESTIYMFSVKRLDKGILENHR